MENHQNQGKVLYISIPLKPYTLKELAALYSVDWRTIKTWLAKIEPQVGKKVGRYYNIAQVRKIFEILDLPGEIRIAA